MHDLLFGPVLLTSVLAGVVALLAPCCVSVMLPAYLSTVFRRRAGVLAATVVFAIGVGTVIVPIGLGASFLSAAFQRWHTPLFATGGVAMLAGGVAVLFGWSPKMPMPGGRAPAGTGVGAVYGLGVFSGIASACCAPVLVGVSVLAGATASFPAALSVAGAYVVGMVAPLLVMSLGWERLGTRAVRALQTRRVPVYPGARRRVPLGGLLSGLLLMGMGVLTVVLAATGPDMATAGWRVTFTAALQHSTAIVGRDLRWLPGWVVILLLIAAVGGVGYTLRRRATHPAEPTAAIDADPTHDAAAPMHAAPSGEAAECCTTPVRDGTVAGPPGGENLPSGAVASTPEPYVGASADPTRQDGKP